ncbi:hypothetical protein DV451_005149 [Geotrichum candidum]|uniref:Thioredoxin peroxidase n=1 Tax=Geotrichum candidum TaxID=1173061 RepID=A0A9P5FZZ0_GEOCN|nr:hypothetical protein DV451_005149 [Geotrichum candidum]KAI9210060.1 hypothetical protein DS838_005059 [Geotrichum bryndzae]KAF5106653.1 hypothetical protein DV452_005049 [Geotrichum candidum]KAF5109967.1 hypothetical protein DV453_001258 [Geotrichum candidum]KAF5111907.1 hypothetical protein DV454_004512 [Geotrichum candidum]
MALSVGDSFPPNVKFSYVPYTPENSDVLSACGIPTVYDTEKEFANKKVVIVSVPGAFTPTCTANHIPPFIQKVNEIKAKGVDDIIILSANDPFVQAAWGKALGGADKLIFASDGNAAFSEAVGLSVDLSSRGFGKRTARYAIIVDHNKVTYVEQEPGPGVTVSGVEAVLAHL